MASLDVFNSDPFSLTSLTDRINKVPFKPGMLAPLFSAKGIPTTTLFVEEKSGVLSLVQTSARGGPGGSVGTNMRTARAFRVPHLQQNGTVLADEVQNIRAFGEESVAQTIQDLVDERNTEMRENILVTQEYHRMGAIQGLILDADGSTIYNLFTEFGVSQQTLDIALGTDGTKVRARIVAAKRLAENELGGVTVLGWTAFCGAAYFDALVDHPAVTEAFKYQQGQQLQDDLRETGFKFGGVTWKEYRGSVAPQAGGAAVDFVNTNQAWLVPTVPGMLVTRFAPADYEETVNTMGLPFYAKQAPDPSGFNKYRALEVQSNPISLNTRPRAVIKLTKS